MQPLSSHTHTQPAQDSFSTLRSLLEEMASTLKSRYLQSDIGEAAATFEVGFGHGRTVWAIQATNDDHGFTVRKVQHFLKEEDVDLFDFSNESDIVEYLVKEIVECIVYCRHWQTEEDAKLKATSNG